jgi:hypothetical protein
MLAILPFFSFLDNYVFDHEGYWLWIIVVAPGFLLFVNIVCSVVVCSIFILAHSEHRNTGASGFL